MKKEGALGVKTSLQPDFFVMYHICHFTQFRQEIEISEGIYELTIFIYMLSVSFW